MDHYGFVPLADSYSTDFDYLLFCGNLYEGVHDEKEKKREER